MESFYIHAINQSSVYDVAKVTALDAAPKLSKRLGHHLFFKREDLQPVFSFKLRGAYNKIAQLSPEEFQSGVICASAGNHAQGVALSAQKRGCKATIVMPRTTPEIKVNAVESMGGHVVLHGDSYSDASEKAQQLCRENGMCYVHPYDDPLVIAGQGTVARELLLQAHKPIDVVFVPIGGGGLAAGMSVYLKHMSPETRIIGVEPDDSDAMKRSISAGKRVTLEQVGIFADGVAVKKVGEHTFDLVKKYVDEIMVVSADEICAAIKDIFDDSRSVVEPAGALAVAAAKKYLSASPEKSLQVVCVNSGANMNFDRLRYVAERAEIGEEREALFAVTISEKAGSFLTFCDALKSHHITEFNYRLSDRQQAQVFVGISLNGETVSKDIETMLVSQGYPVMNLMHNELARLHLRHMVGGRSALVKDEVLYRFEFPERPSALLFFLAQIAGRWNISMFHYRNHGAAFGRVLVGMEVPLQDREDFASFLAQVGFPAVEESNNPAYQLFL
ncbi:MAG: threonine ammonia-lyase, biosynthetic [Mariprofundaceae bacterium]|nr:threonine ammonia-lyase, biosynthetic [Mariprofundaceae bacterium]